MRWQKLLAESQQQKYPYLHSYLKLYDMFSGNCTRKCRRKCVCQLRSLIIADTIYDSQFRPYPHWL